MKFYHLTTEKALPSILEHGLKPEYSESSLEAIFLSNCLDTAEQYCAMREDDSVLLEINITASHYELGPDNYELRDFLQSMDKEELKSHKLYEGATWEDCSWRQSLKICNQVACYTNIEPKYIKVLKHIPNIT